MTPRQRAAAWCRWLGAMGLPIAHISCVLDMPMAEAESYLAGRQPRPARLPPCTANPNCFNRPTRDKLRKLQSLGYDAATIATALLIPAEQIAHYLDRLYSRRDGQGFRARSTADHDKVLANRRRRAAQAQASAERSARHQQRRLRAQARRELQADRRAAMADWGGRDARTDDDAPAPQPTALPANERPKHEGRKEAPATTTPEPNRWHQRESERGRRGARHPRAAVHWHDVDEIRRRAKHGATAYEIAQTHWASETTIRAIIRGDAWPESERPDITAAEEEPCSEATSDAQMTDRARPAERSNRWRTGKKKPKLYARGSGGQRDDEPHPLPCPARDKRPVSRETPEK